MTPPFPEDRAKVTTIRYLGTGDFASLRAFFCDITDPADLRIAGLRMGLQEVMDRYIAAGKYGKAAEVGIKCGVFSGLLDIIGKNRFEHIVCGLIEKNQDIVCADLAYAIRSRSYFGEIYGPETVRLIAEGLTTGETIKLPQALAYTHLATAVSGHEAQRSVLTDTQKEKAVTRLYEQGKMEQLVDLLAQTKILPYIREINIRNIVPILLRDDTSRLNSFATTLQRDGASYDTYRQTVQAMAGEYSRAHDYRRLGLLGMYCAVPEAREIARKTLAGPQARDYVKNEMSAEWRRSMGLTGIQLTARAVRRMLGVVPRTASAPAI